MDTTAPASRTRRRALVAVAALLGTLAGALAVLAGPTAAPVGAAGPYTHTGPGMWVPDSGRGSVWPSRTADVQRGTVITGLTVTIRDIHHFCVKDLDIALLHNGARTMLLSDAGEKAISFGCHDVHITALTISDACPAFPNPLPVEARTLPGTAICARPTDADGTGHEGDTMFEVKADTTPAAPLLPTFGAPVHAEGTWDLYVVDDSTDSQGEIGGWGIDITTSDRPPTARNSVAGGTKGVAQPLVFDARDPEDGTALRCEILDHPDQGTVSEGTGCQRTYTANPRSQGIDQVTFRAYDRFGNGSEPATATIQIENRAPSARTVVVDVLAGERIDLALGGTDPDPDERVGCRGGLDPRFGTMHGTGCTRSYVAGSEAGVDDLTYETFDDFGGRTTGTIRIEVYPRTPWAHDQAVTAPKGGPGTAITLTGTVPAGGAHTCEVDAATAQRKGTLGGTGCTRTFTPHPGTGGTDTFTFLIRSQDGIASARATVTITIPNRAPAAPTQAITVLPGDSAAVALGGTDPDPGEGVALTCTPTTGPTARGRVSGAGCFATYTAGTTPGADSFTYTVRDPSGATATGRVDVTVDGTAPAGCTAADDRDARYVCRTYTDLLGRPADAGGKAYWLGRLARGEARSAIVKAFTGTPEYRTSVVRGIWRAYLGTTPDAATTQRWVEQLGRGANPDLVRQEALASAAFLARAGGTPEGFVAGVHQQLLRRPATATEVRTLAAQVTAGTTHATIVGRLLATTDADRATVAPVYERFLRRSPPAAEADYWVGRLQRGESELALVRLIVASAEYHGRA